MARKLQVLNNLKGKSAYEVALDNGFEGTEAEWLASLKGAPGDGITVDDALSETSENPVQNKVIYGVVQEVSAALQGMSANIPTTDSINALIDAYLSEALGGDY